MNEERWFDEILSVPNFSSDTSIYKSYEPFLPELALTLGLETSTERGGQLARDVEKTLEKCVEGTIRIHQPRWRVLDDVEAQHLFDDEQNWSDQSQDRPAAVLVRLGVEFALPSTQLAFGRQWKFISSWQRVFLWTRHGDQPRVLAIQPDRILEGAPHNVRVEFEPKISVGPIGVSLGKIGTDVSMGTVSAVTIGYYGEQERNPYWELRSGPTPIEGIYHFWLILEMPRGVPVNLAPLAEADLQAHLWRIPVGPKERAKEKRPNIVIQV